MPGNRFFPQSEELKGEVNGGLGSLPEKTGHELISYLGSLESKGALSMTELLSLMEHMDTTMIIFSNPTEESKYMVNLYELERLTGEVKREDPYELLTTLGYNKFPEPKAGDAFITQNVRLHTKCAIVKNGDNSIEIYTKDEKFTDR